MGEADAEDVTAAELEVTEEEERTLLEGVAVGYALELVVDVELERAVEETEVEVEVGPRLGVIVRLGILIVLSCVRMADVVEMVAVDEIGTQVFACLLTILTLLLLPCPTALDCNMLTPL